MRSRDAERGAAPPRGRSNHLRRGGSTHAHGRGPVPPENGWGPSRHRDVKAAPRFAHVFNPEPDSGDPLASLLRPSVPPLPFVSCHLALRVSVGGGIGRAWPVFLDQILRGGAVRVSRLGVEIIVASALLLAFLASSGWHVRARIGSAAPSLRFFAGAQRPREQAPAAMLRDRETAWESRRPFVPWTVRRDGRGVGVASSRPYTPPSAPPVPTGARARSDHPRPLYAALLLRRSRRALSSPNDSESAHSLLP